MNKADVIDAVANKAGLSKKDAKNAVEATLETITESLAKKDTVTFIGFGTFYTSHRNESTRTTPQKKVVTVPATTVAKFKVGKNLKDKVA